MPGSNSRMAGQPSMSAGSKATPSGPTRSFVSPPLRPLTRNERMVAYLLGEGLSGAEVSRAMRIERSEAQEAIGTVLRKLKLRSAGEVADLLEDRREASAPISLALKP